MRRLSFFIAAPLIVRAAVAAETTVPAVVIPSSWSVLASSPSGPAPQTAWWKALRDPLLDRLVARALEGNRTLEAAAQRLDEARLQKKIVLAQYMPQINASGSFTRARISETIQPVLDAGQQRIDNFGYVGLQASWEIDFWGHVWKQVESARAGERAVQENYRDVLVLLLADVGSTYTDLRTTQARLAFAQKNVQLQRDTLTLAAARNRAGLAPKLDVRQAELNLARTESLVPTLMALETSFIDQLAVLLGCPLQPLRQELAPAGAIPAAPEEFAAQIPAETLRQRPDVRRAEQALAAQTALIGVRRAELLPLVTLHGDVGWRSRGDSDIFSTKNQSYGGGPQLDWTIFKGGALWNQLRAERSRTAQSAAAYEQTILAALSDTDSALAAHLRERDRYAALARAVQAAEESVKLVRVLYKSGLTNFQNVLDMQRSLFDQQDLLAQSDGARTTTLIQLYRALGGGWNAQGEPS